MKLLQKTICMIGLAAAAVLRAEDTKPNILFIIADDLGARLGCYGEQAVKSPNLDKLAEQGTMFENCYAQFTSCGPSRMSMLSGLYPYESGLNKQKHYPEDSRIPFTLLPKLFRQNGYFTARVGKVYHMGIPQTIGKHGRDKGDSWDLAVNNGGWDGLEENYTTAHRHGNNKNWGIAVSYLDPDIKDEEMADGAGTQQALRIMSEHNPAKTGKPLMLFMGYYRPHPPMIVPKSHWEAIRREDITLPTVPENDRADIPASVFYHGRDGKGTDDFHFIPESVGTSYSHAYYAAIHFLDTEVGKLIDGLKQNGLDKNTIIVFAGDQGFHLGEHGNWHKASAFDVSSHVPLIIVDPREKQAKQNASGLCGLIDLYPTLCNLTGVKPEHKLSGMNLAPFLKDPNRVGKPWEFTQGNYLSVRTERYRLTKMSDGEMLYDFQNDPEEWTNQINNPEYKTIKAKLSSIIDSVIPEELFVK